MRSLAFAACVYFGCMILQSAIGARADQPVYCDCQFDQSSGYVGVGTAAGCSAISRKNTSGKGERCVFSVGATSYDPSAISRLKAIPQDYRSLAFRVTFVNLQAIQDRDYKIISTEEYLRDAIPAYMRAVYLRSDAELEEPTLELLDRLVVDATNRYAEQIAHVFQGKPNKFDVEFGDSLKVHAVRGAVIMDYRDNLVQLHLVASFFDPRTVQ